MLYAILSILGSSAVGTITGGVFAFLNKKQETQMQLARLQHELALRDKDLEMLKIEQQGLLAVAQETTEAARFTAIGQSHSAEALDSGSLSSAGGWRWILVLAEAVRRFIRPAATVALLSGALWVNWLVLKHVTNNWGSLSLDQQNELVAQCLGWIFGQSSAVISYWFVSRGNAR